MTVRGVLAGLLAGVCFCVYNLAFFSSVVDGVAIVLSVGYLLGVGTAAGAVFAVYEYRRVNNEPVDIPAAYKRGYFEAVKFYESLKRDEEAGS